MTGGMMDGHELINVPLQCVSGGYKSVVFSVFKPTVDKKKDN